MSDFSITGLKLTAAITVAITNYSINYLGKISSLMLMLVLVLFSFYGIENAEGVEEGENAACDRFQVDLGVAKIDFRDVEGDPGWVYVKQNEKFHSVTGKVTMSQVNHVDFMSVHYSHDWTSNVLVDEGLEDVLSKFSGDDLSWPGAPDTLHIEWETGIRPSEKYSEADPFFPRWAWPSVGDRVWANGHWVYDCAHVKKVGSLEGYKTEIHPVRAIASMRSQVLKIPVSPLNVATPFPVTVVDLYIHGRGGFATDILNCGQSLILTYPRSDECPTYPRPEHQTTPIDVDFEFDVCLPRKIVDNAVPVAVVRNGPGNTVGVAPILQPVPVPTHHACAGGGSPLMIHVKVPLAGSGVQPRDVYARTIYTGWVYALDPFSLYNIELTLTRMVLADDQELDPGDCDCTFFWVNVDRAPNEWERLSLYQTETCNAYRYIYWGKCTDKNTMGSWDDYKKTGNGHLDFTGPTFNFYVYRTSEFTVRANGYDQDCFDDFFGRYNLRETYGSILACAGKINNAGQNDNFNKLEKKAIGPNYSLGQDNKVYNDGNQYHMIFYREVTPVSDSVLNLSSLGIPRANAGPDLEVYPGDTTALNGLDSSDPNGDILTFFWRQTAGSPVTLDADPLSDLEYAIVHTQACQTESCPDAVLTFELIVYDGIFYSSPDYVNVKVTLDAQKKLEPPPGGIPPKRYFIPSEAGAKIFKITVEDQTFDVPVTGEGIISLGFSQDERAIGLETDGSAGTIEVEIPKELLGGQLTVAADGNEIEFKISETETHSVLLIEKPAESNVITIHGTTVIPEFSSVVVLVLLAAIVSLALVIARTGSNSFVKGRCRL